MTSISTADPLGARAHARAQSGTVAATQPTVPAAGAVDLPAGVAPADVLWDERLGAGGYAARRLPRGARLRLTDLDGDACAGLVVHNARRTEERLCVPDTVKLQWNAYLGPGKLLLSDQGRVLLTILADTCGVHDAFCGTSTAARNRARYGSGDNYGPAPNGRDRFLLGLAKHGLGRRDLPANVNFFKGVRVGEDGSLRFVGDGSAPGAHVELRAELDVLVSVVNVPHVLDPRPAYRAGVLRCTAWSGAPAPPDDPWRTASPESRRAFENTEDELLGWEGGR